MTLLHTQNTHTFFLSLSPSREVPSQSHRLVFFTTPYQPYSLSIILNLNVSTVSSTLSLTSLTHWLPNLFLVSNGSFDFSVQVDGYTLTLPLRVSLWVHVDTGRHWSRSHPGISSHTTTWTGDLSSFYSICFLSPLFSLRHWEVLGGTDCQW